jgi:hypothetical protein
MVDCHYFLRRENPALYSLRFVCFASPWISVDKGKYQGSDCFDSINTTTANKQKASQDRNEWSASMLFEGMHYTLASANVFFDSVVGGNELRHQRNDFF